uniref:Reverse transcriptase/retrotransposon-derived protein RNase H-like domain-containing protein n=1 Tax=Sparus aurata TaxID=8175 RepID=A0A671UB87_SPAAU
MVFSSEKCAIKQKSISFFGNLYTENGIKPDFAKIRDIQKMPTPQNTDELHRFMGMLTYLAAYIPKFADKAHILRGLLKNEALWLWEADHQKCFEELKSAIAEDACLKYYDASTPLTLEVDTSQKGIGLALVQNNRPSAFGSKSLTKDGYRIRYFYCGLLPLRLREYSPQLGTQSHTCKLVAFLRQSPFSSSIGSFT